MSAENGDHRTVTVIAGTLNILALLTILLSVLFFTPLTVIISLSIGGFLMAVSIILYVIMVLRDLSERGII